MQTDIIVSSPPSTLPARRRAIARAAAAVGALAVANNGRSQTAQNEMKEAPTAPANLGRTSIHQEIAVKASVERIYRALLDPKQFAAFSGMPADIGVKEGDAFSMFAGVIVGRNVELVPNRRIVQAWRSSHWPQGSYSIVKFELLPQDAGAMVVLDHRGFPDGQYDNLFSGWNEHYWEPLRKFIE